MSADGKATTVTGVQRLVTRRSASRTIAAAALTALAGGPAAAQEPGRPITIIVPFSPGTGPDILGRAIAEKLQPRLGQPVIVDNKSGASGTIGVQLAMRAEPDGHTLVMTADPPFTANVTLLKAVPYDPIKDFTPITEPAVGTLAFVVEKSLPVGSMQDFIPYAKARPGEINYGSPGVGTAHHLAMEFLKLTAQIDLMHVPFRDTAGAIANLAGGHISAMFLPIHVSLPLAPDRIRILAVGGKSRVAQAPDAPTLMELGFTELDADIRFGVFAPAGLPPAIVGRYNALIDEILREPEMTERLAKQGLTVVAGPSGRFAENTASDLLKWQKVIRSAKISPE